METVLFEDFTGTELNRTIWNPATHYKRGIGFLVDSSLTIDVNNGNLELKMYHSPNYLDSIWELDEWVQYYANYIGGEVSSYQKFKYGIFECRAKFANSSGSWPAFWIIGGDGIPCPVGGYGNEIDIAEMWCETPVPEFGHTIHRYYPSLDCIHSNVEQKDSYKYLFSSNNYNLFRCIWTPQRIEYYLNGNLMHSVVNNGQEWYPSLSLNVVLSQQILQGYDLLGRSIPPIAPQTSYFDYIKVKRFFLSPEITCPDVICSTSTATLDVDSLASNITWSLTPGYLFSGATSGSGTSVSVVPTTNGYHGMGKITFTFNMPSGETFTAEKEIRVNGPAFEDIS